MAEAGADRRERRHSKAGGGERRAEKNICAKQITGNRTLMVYSVPVLLPRAP